MAKKEVETKAVEQTAEKTVSKEEFIQRKIAVLNAIGGEKAERAMNRIIAVNSEKGGIH